MGAGVSQAQTLDPTVPGAAFIHAISGDTREQMAAVDSGGTMYIATRRGVLDAEGTRLVRQPVFADQLWWERRLVHVLAALALAAAFFSAHRFRVRYWANEARRHKRSAAQKDEVLAAVAERETWFGALLKHASDTIFLLDRDGRISYVSPSRERVTGVRPDSVVGRLLVDVVRPADRESVTAALHDILAHPRQPIPFRYRVELPNVGLRIFSAIGRNLLDEKIVGGIIVNTRDVTEQEEAEALYRQAQKLDAIGALAGGIAHDFNNLLAVISANVAMVKDDLEEQNVSVEGLDKISLATAGGERLTRQLLTFSKGHSTQPTVLDLNEVVAETVPMLRPLIGASIDIVVDPSAAPAPVYLGRSDVEQVIVNLVVNAKAAMPRDGTVTLTIARAGGRGTLANAGAGQDKYVRLSVSDTGTGMDEETRRKIFDPFFTTKETGTGLGLATVQAIVKKSAGHVDVTSDAGRGTTFHLYFPLADREGPAVSAEEGRLSGKTVLVVDDDEDVLRLAERLLRGAGAEVLPARSARQALDIAKTRGSGLDLVLTDLVMPGMSGRELAAELLSEGPVSILFMSGHSDTGIAQTLAQGKDVGFLGKPFNPEKLLAAVEKALAGTGLPPP